MATLGEAKNTIEVLDKYHFIFQKRFGQNFLIDTHVLEKIIRAAEISGEDMVLEIGPGIGTMTQYLCENAREVIAVEIDKNLIPILTEDTLRGYNNVTVINEDILKLDLNRLVQEKNGGRPIKVVANLPYYITTPIIMGLLEKHVPLQNITVMVQREVAERMQAGPGGKDYGALSLAVQYYAEPYLAAVVPPHCFMPRPNVGSAVIRLTLHQKPPVQAENEEFLFRLIRAAFNQRRKTLVNAVSGMDGAEACEKDTANTGKRSNRRRAAERTVESVDGPDNRERAAEDAGKCGQSTISREAVQEALEQMGLSSTVRGEALSLEEFARLADLLSCAEKRNAGSTSAEAAAEH